MQSALRIVLRRWATMKVVRPWSSFSSESCTIISVAVSTALVDRKSTRLNSSHSQISYAVFCLIKKILISLVLLTAILFAQQTVRYLEGTFQGLMPIGFVNGVAVSLLPAVLIFTLPMAVLARTI